MNDGIIKKADVEIKIQLVEYGIQADFYVDEKLVYQYCRDFSDSYPVDDLKEDIYKVLGGAIDIWRGTK